MCTFSQTELPRDAKWISMQNDNKVVSYRHDKLQLHFCNYREGKVPNKRSCSVEFQVPVLVLLMLHAFPHFSWGPESVCLCVCVWSVGSGSACTKAQVSKTKHTQLNRKESSSAYPHRLPYFYPFPFSTSLALPPCGLSLLLALLRAFSPPCLTHLCLSEAHCCTTITDRRPVGLTVCVGGVYAILIFIYSIISF